MFKLRQTSPACPEAYDVYFLGEKIAHFRLRHGSFTIEYKGQNIYHIHPEGCDGVFSVEERDDYLSEACVILMNHVPLPLYQIVNAFDYEEMSKYEDNFNEFP